MADITLPLDAQAAVTATYKDQTGASFSPSTPFEAASSDDTQVTANFNSNSSSSFFKWLIFN